MVSPRRKRTSAGSCGSKAGALSGSGTWAGSVAVLCAVLWAAPVRAQAQPVHDFDHWCKWQRGAQAWGNLTQSDEQVHQGAFAGELAYDFPKAKQPTSLSFNAPAIAQPPNGALDRQP